MLNKAKIINQAYNISKRIFPRWTDLAHRAGKLDVEVLQPLHYSVGQQGGRKVINPKEYYKNQAKAQVQAQETYVKGVINTIFSPRWSDLYRTAGMTQGSTKKAMIQIDKMKKANTPKEIRRLSGIRNAELRGAFLEDVSNGNLGSQNVKNMIRHYEMETSHIQRGNESLFEWAMKRQGFHPNGQLANKNPILIRPKASAGSHAWNDISKDDNMAFVQYMLSLGKKQKVSLERMKEWFGDDYTNFVVGSVAKKRGWSLERAREQLAINGGLPQAEISKGKLYIDQVIMSGDKTMGFAPVTVEVTPNFRMKALVHDVWDNGKPGSPLHQFWTGNQPNLVMQHSNVFNLEPSIMNFRRTEVWGKVQNKVKRAVKNPERAGQGKSILESAKIQYGNDHKAMSDELLARLESYLNYQVRVEGKSPLKAIDEIIVALGSGTKKGIDKKWLAEVMSNDAMVAIDPDSYRRLALARERAAKVLKNKKPQQDISDMNLWQKITTSINAKTSKELKDLHTFMMKESNKDLPQQAIDAYINRRILPAVLGGSGIAGSGYVIYKASKE
jgi:hypothetical protein